MITNDIKSSAKKLVINNLCRIFGDSITFVGSLCDVLYLRKPLHTTKDIDIKVNISDRSYFIYKLLTSDWFVYSEDKRIFTVKPFRTYEPIRNFGIHNSSYTSDNQPSFKYSYHVHIFGVPIDISFYCRSCNDIAKYSRFLNFPKQYINCSITKPIKTSDGKFALQSPESRVQLLNYSINNQYSYEIVKKHKEKLLMYSEHIHVHVNKKFIQNIKYTNLFYDVSNFHLPSSFDTQQYKKQNDNLKQLTTKDSLIDHYIAHGIFENAKVY